MKRNFNVVLDFIREEGEMRSKSKNLYVNDYRELVNYNTVIAKINGFPETTKEIVIDVNYYSNTTSKIQASIMRAIRFYRSRGRELIVVLNGTEKRIKQFEKILKGIVA